MGGALKKKCCDIPYTLLNVFKSDLINLNPLLPLRFFLFSSRSCRTLITLHNDIFQCNARLSNHVIKPQTVNQTESQTLMLCPHHLSSCIKEHPASMLVSKWASAPSLTFEAKKAHSFTLEMYRTSFKRFGKCFHYCCRNVFTTVELTGAGSMFPYVVHGALIKARWQKLMQSSAPNQRSDSSSLVVFLAFHSSEVCFVLVQTIF